ncbi:TRF-like 8, putative isoform 1 [Hibiscus syriacus]|uniref:TRF-like 8, putative isoform 1 n=1 Tax=Hibiscus syriacus TaxID=106335 RepID=A0A6A3BHB5_HIBSY|nr:TRF-like 8, putative isoform 1 [Hibiscus syriacus]
MKLLVLFIVTMLLSCSCMAGGLRRAMVAGIYEHQRDHVVDNRNVVQGRKNAVEDSLDNHHNIPRQRYDDWGNNSPDNGDEGSHGGYRLRFVFAWL